MELIILKKFWREFLILTLGLAFGASIYFLNAEKDEFKSYKLGVEIREEIAEKQIKEVKKNNAFALEKSKSDYEKQLKGVIDNAAKRYENHFHQFGAGGLLPQPSASDNATADGAQASDGASKEPMAAGGCRTEFIKDAANDALKIKNFQDWVRSVGFPVEGEHAKED